MLEAMQDIYKSWFRAQSRFDPDGERDQAVKEEVSEPADFSLQWVALKLSLFLV